MVVYVRVLPPSPPGVQGVARPFVFWTSKFNLSVQKTLLLYFELVEYYTPFAGIQVGQRRQSPAQKKLAPGLGMTFPPSRALLTRRQGFRCGDDIMERPNAMQPIGYQPGGRQTN